MKCEEIAEFLPDYWQEGLGAEQKRNVERHLESCKRAGEMKGSRAMYGRVEHLFGACFSGCALRWVRLRGASRWSAWERTWDCS
jgi:hypothetical protein